MLKALPVIEFTARFHAHGVMPPIKCVARHIGQAYGAVAASKPFQDFRLLLKVCYGATFSA